MPKRRMLSPLIFQTYTKSFGFNSLKSRLMESIWFNWILVPFIIAFRLVNCIHILRFFSQSHRNLFAPFFSIFSFWSSFIIIFRIEMRRFDDVDDTVWKIFKSESNTPPIRREINESVVVFWPLFLSNSMGYHIYPNHHHHYPFNSIYFSQKKILGKNIRKKFDNKNFK